MNFLEHNGAEVPGEQMLSIEDVAQRLSMTKRQVRKLLMDKEIPEPLVIGGKQRWTMKQLRDWIAGLEAKRDGRTLEQNE